MATATILGRKFLKASEINQKAVGSDSFIISFASRDNDIQDALENGLRMLGGIEKYLFHRCRVLIKPTMAWNREPGTGYNSDPLLVKKIINLCYEGGAREVSLFDNTFDEWALTYKNSGIERIAKDAAARVIPANDIRYYKPLNFGGKTNNHIKIHEALINADVVINLPVVKADIDITISGALANYLGCVWDRKSCFNENSACLNEFLQYKKPHLNISEIWPDKVFNPEMSTSDQTKAIVFSHNPIASDVLTARLLSVGTGNISGLANALKLYPDAAIIEDSRIKFIFR